MDILGMIISIAAVIVAGFIGYLSGYKKIFHEAKQEAYRKAIPVLAKAIYDLPNIKDEKEFNEATILIWMYGSKNVAKKFDKALGDMFSGDEKRTNQLTKKMQELIVAIRYDIQTDWPKLKADEIEHIYAKFV